MKSWCLPALIAALFVATACAAAPPEAAPPHWAFQPLAEATPPDTTDKSWPRNAVDRFILARLEKEGLSPSAEAGPAIWLRRVFLDLTGLPPAPEDVEQFLSGSPPPCAATVDRLLASPRYGERWAQHWLDVVRYADTHGYEVNTERPNAWPYRDWVIRSFNSDMPYDRFIREQIAGDAIGADAATGFLITASVLLPGQIGADDVSKRLARQDALDDIVVNVSQSFLALSVGCARCHDHKFDPISQRDYYSMQAFVAGVEYEDREMRTPEADAMRAEEKRLTQRLTEVEQKLARLTPLAKSGLARPPVNARLNTDRITPVTAQRVRLTIRETNSLEPCVDELEVFTTAGTNIALASAGATVTSSGNTTVADRHELRFVNDGAYGNSRSWMSSESGKGWVAVAFPAAQTIDRIVWARDRLSEFKDRLAISYVIEIAEDGTAPWRTVADSSDRAPYFPDKSAPAFSTTGLTPAEAAEATALMEERKKLEPAITAATTGRIAFAGKFRTPDNIRLLARGDPEQPKDPVLPAVLTALGSLSLPPNTPEQQRRLALSDWIASPQNPLTTRVMVNRIWQGHFGTGLVETSSDFGRNGARPSHPELLDWLAAEFIRSGWSVKQMHRLIVLSAAYRQSSSVNSVAAAQDAGARLLWRFPSRRLEAETIRDAMLAVSGTLNLTMYGRGYDLFDKRGGLSGFKPVEFFTGEGLRRMIYAHKIRREREAVFGAFDCPDAGQSTARRPESTTPIQALNLFNSRFTLDAATALAARIAKETGPDIPSQIRRAWFLTLSRAPTPEELTEAEPVVRAHGLATVCRALFNSSEFLFLP